MMSRWATPPVRSSVELRTTALSHLFTDLADLHQSVRDAELPEFTSVFKPKSRRFFIDPNIFVDPPQKSTEGTASAGMLAKLKLKSLAPARKGRETCMGRTRTGRDTEQKDDEKRKNLTLSPIEGRKTKDPPAYARAMERIRQQALARRASLNRILQATGSLEKYKPEAVRESRKTRAVQADFRSNLTKIARIEIYESRRHKHLEVLEDKLRRCDWRQRANDIFEGKKRWASIIYYLSSLGVFIEKQTRRKQLHERSQGILKFLLMMTISVGKFVCIVKRSRYRRAFSVIHRIAPYLNRWRKRQEQKKKERLTEFIENSLSQDVFYKIIVLWKSKILAIQRLIRSWLLRRRAHRLLLVLSWGRLESALSKNSRPTDLPPKSVKYILVSDLLKAKMKTHLEELEHWREACSRVLAEHEKWKYELLETPVAVPQFPPKPRFPVFLDKTELLSLMSQAEKKKSRWTRISKERKAITPSRRDLQAEDD